MCRPTFAIVRHVYRLVLGEGLRMSSRWHVAALLIILVAPSAQAQDNPHPVRWAAIAARVAIRAGDTAHVAIRAGDTARVAMRATIAEFFHLYSTTQPPGGPIRTTISLVPGGPFALNGRVRAPVPDSIPDGNFGIMSEVYSDSVTFGITLRADTRLATGRATALALVRYQACTARYCLPPRVDTVAFAFLVSSRTVR